MLRIEKSKGTLSEKDLAKDYSNYVTLNNVEVHYEIQKGKNNKQVFLLLHGFGSNTFSYRKLLPALAKYGTVISYDRPSFGLTVRPKSWTGLNPYSYKAQLNLLDELIKHFGENKQVILCGHSAGAAIAAEWALAHQDKVAALILEDPAILTMPPSSRLLGKILKSKPFDVLGPRLVAGFKKAGLKILYKSWFNQKGITQEVLDGYLLPLEIKGWEAAFWEFTRSGIEATIQSKLAELKVKTLVITGDHDYIVPVKDSKAVAEQIGKCSYVEIENCGHIPHEEKPEEFLKQVELFLTSNKS